MNSKITNTNISLKNLFFKWLQITRSFHKLPFQAEQVLALLLYHHYLLKKDITNNKILWKIVFDYDTKLAIKEDEIFVTDKTPEGLSDNSLQNVLTSLRKAGVIVDNEIVNAYIPDLNSNSKNFKIIFNFNITDNE